MARTTNRSRGSTAPKPLDTPTDIAPEGVAAIAEALNGILADSFALYLKTKNFHWHVSGSHFRDYHLLLDEQGTQIFATTDELAERVRKIGGTTLRSIGDIARHQSLADNDEDYVAPRDAPGAARGQQGRRRRHAQGPRHLRQVRGRRVREPA
jgi:starvation-inducible DNA-binding protein